MKRLDELGISQTPWEICDWCAGHISIASKSGWRVCETRESADARLIAAAPKLYSDGYDDCLALRAIVRKMDDGMVILNLRDTLAKMADRIEAALAKAAGEGGAIHGE